MEKNEKDTKESTSLSQESLEFFALLSDENEEKYISALKKSSLKLWTFTNEEGLTALHYSISLDLYKLTKELIESAKNNLSQKDFTNYINQKTNKGQTPLHYASFVGNIKIIKLLIQNGADLMSKTNGGLNLLHLAIMGNKITSFYYFNEKYKISINLKDNKDNTSLHLATYYNSKKIFNYLLTNNKIDINAKNKEGFTPLHFAVISQNQSMIKKLLIKGADSSIRNNQSYTASDLAKQKNNQQINNIFKGNNCKYKILMYSNITKIFLTVVSLLPFLFIFYIRLDIKIIFYLIWVIILIFFIIKFYMSNPTHYYKNDNYLLNLLEVEEKNIEDYCIYCKIIQHYGTVHCFICNVCIEGFDHHCFWINKCVGAKNKKNFYHLICAMQIHAIINFFVCILIINGQKNENSENMRFGDLIKCILIVMNTLILIISTIVICPLIKFYYYQSKEKTSSSIDFNEKNSNRLLNRLDEEESV
jgi:ankyrin repeat protein